AISFNLIVEAERLSTLEFPLWMMLGVAVFLVGDRVVEKRFGSAGTGAAIGIVVGSVVDGVPESVIFGIQIGAGIPISVPFLAAVLISNVPQALAPSADLAAAGWGAMRLGRLWLAVVLACGVAASGGYLVATVSASTHGDRAAALAAGGLIAMLANSLMPFAYEHGREWAGVATAVGFTLSLVVS
ncbi:MAG TPA: hypothetical protein VMT88_09685, partial [Actinomycetes bacterium]|nr:hypothetical protein [Actinomycetes bacterium]